MSEDFGPDFFRGNRAQLKKLFLGKAPIVLTANGLLQSTADMAFPFRQDRNFWYLTGMDEPSLVLVMDKDKEFIILPEGYAHRARFDGALTEEQISHISGVGEVLDYKSGWDKLKQRLKRVKHVATLAANPSYVEHYGFYTNPARAELVEMLNSHGEPELLDLRKHFAVLRMVKQPEELKAIRRAIDITSKTLKGVMSKAWSATVTEAAIANEMDYHFRKLGSDGPAFDTIVAAAGNTATIHHRPGNIKLASDALLLLDVGAQVHNYAADISRVMVVGKSSRRTRQVYDCVLEALDYSIGLLKPGVLMDEFEKSVEKFVGEKLRELGLIKLIDKKSVRKYFPTYASHHLGLDPHDAHEQEIALKPNMVLAVEPGIYIPEEGIGIRIEENVLITEDGNRVLTDGLSRELKSLTIKEA